MLDTKARVYVQPVFNQIARVFIKTMLTPKQITVLALIFGIFSSIMLYYDLAWIALLLLWISGFFDVIDGSIARLTGQSSEFGALMDIIFDRIVEIGIILSLALKYHDARMSLMFLLSSIIFSFSIFLTVGALSDRKSEKAFYYQAGLAERTETFIVFSLIMLFPDLRIVFINLFTIMILYTGAQRFYEAYKIFGK